MLSFWPLLVVRLVTYSRLMTCDVRYLGACPEMHLKAMVALISEINSRAHRVIKEAKDAKFAALLKKLTSKTSTSSCDPSLGKRTVVKIPEDLLLNSAEHSLLSKGLTFVRMVNKTDEYQVKADC